VVIDNPTAVSDIIDIADATKDQFSAFTITLPVSETTLLQPGASNTTLVSGVAFPQNAIAIIDNTQETVKTANNLNSIALPGATESMVETSDAKTIYAAVRSTSQVSVVDVASFAISTNVTVPSVRRLALAHNNSKVLAFSDNSDSLTVINTADNTTTTVSGFDRPFFAVFSSDDTKAYVLNCGPECGGTKAGVTILDLTQTTLAPGTTLPVPAATTALMDSGKLYVAGSAVSPGNPSGTGQLTIIDLGSFTSVGNPIQIGNGFHSLLSLASNNKLFVGARTCTTKCLSIVDLSGNTATIADASGNVTGIAPIPGRNVVYVTVGADVVIYDTATSKPQATQLGDIVGTTVGVVAP
jgi:hypothetical protein